MVRFSALLLVLVACACSRPADRPSTANSGAATTAAITKLPAFDAARMLADIKVLSSDEFEGRAPGSKGEELTVTFLQDAFTKIGLKPGNTDGTFVQPLPLVGITATNTRPLTVTGRGKTTTFRWRDDLVAWTKRVADTASIENSELIFAGYGVDGSGIQLGRLQGRRRQRQDDPGARQRSADSERVRSVAARRRACSTARR